MTLIGKLISLFIGSLHTWVCSDCALQTHVCPLMFPRRGGMKWPASKKPSKKTSKKQKKRPKSVMAKETLVSETCGRNAWGKWRETSGKGPVLVFSFGSRPWRPWVQHQLPSGSRRAMIHNMCGVKLWFNLLLLVVWNIFYFSIYWEFHNPNWRTPSFFRGVGIPPTSTGIPSWSQIRLLQIASNVNVVNLGAESEPCSVCSW